MEVRSVIGYRVDHVADHEDLISLAVRFSPTFHPAEDPIGLAKTLNKVALEECALAVQAMKRIAKRKDADRILREDPKLYSEMVEAMEDLLELARYDIAAYRAWLKEG
jgi:hypothetical protein